MTIAMLDTEFNPLYRSTVPALFLIRGFVFIALCVAIA